MSINQLNKLLIDIFILILCVILCVAVYSLGGEFGRFKPVPEPEPEPNYGYIKLPTDKSLIIKPTSNNHYVAYHGNEEIIEVVYEP